ncbi:glycosyltransferase [Halomicrobium sp. HM KBTZ05]|uniref:glycosyltransferase n=1 Tax=Halomicrobium sp. HM KBTZ05 TaxID=3242663 RepID=UPI0035568A0B
MGRILVICAQSPYPVVDGARLRTYNTAKILQQEHDIHLLIVNQEPDDDLETLATEFTGVTSFSHESLGHEFTKYGRAGAAFARGNPIRPAYYHFSDVQKWVNEHVGEYDLCYANYVNTVPYVQEDRFVVDFVDSMSHNRAQLAEIHSPPRSWLSTVESRRLNSYERTVAQAAEHSFVTTVHDMTAMGIRNDVTVVPNGVRETYLERPNTVNTDPGRIVFLGRMDYYPNVDAVRYFADEVFPQVRAEVDTASFVVVGSNPSEEVRTLDTREGITVTGFVDEPAEHLELATAVVAPMRYGTGIQNKVLEAMALGKPVVTTSLGAAGISAENGTHLLVADDATAMSERTIAVLTDPQLAASVGGAARERISDQHTWDAVAPQLLDGISEAMD